MCRVLKVSRSGYYAWRTRAESRRSLENRRLTERIRAIHAESRGRYGSPRIHAMLRRSGEACGKNRVCRLMAAAAIRARHKKRFRSTTDSKHSLPVAENLLLGDVTVDRPNQVWAADITYIPTDEGWVYLGSILDLCSRTVVGWCP